MKIFSTLLVLAISLPLFAHDVIIKGHVYDQATKKAIESVNIYVKDRPVGTTSKDDGSFELKVSNANNKLVIVFDHISFDTLQVSLGSALKRNEYYLISRTMEGDQITVEAEKESPFSKDLTQTITMIGSKEFEGRGYVDVGDLLRTDQSVQIEEELSGKKTMSLRGGNPEDVIVFYNGIKMNSNYDNVFDLSLLNLEDIQRIEIIKGSNTALYGSEAFSGVVNIVPKTRQDYTARFVQKFGSYDSGDWNLQVNHSFKDRLYLSYNHKQAGSRRPYASGEDVLQNETMHNSATLYYDMSDSKRDAEHGISVIFMRADLQYDNSSLLEKIDDLNQMVSLRYAGPIGPVAGWEISAAHQLLENRQDIALKDGEFKRETDNTNLMFNLQKTFVFDDLNIIASYQREDGDIDYIDRRDYLDFRPEGLQSAVLTRTRNSFVALFNYDASLGGDLLEKADVDVSYRYDRVKDGREDALTVTPFGDTLYTSGTSGENSWEESMLKFSFNVGAQKGRFKYNIFLNTGTNVRFPTLFNQISQPGVVGTIDGVTSNLAPERNRSSELGFQLTRIMPAVSFFEEWRFHFNYFQNTYDNKFRSYYVPYTPTALFDNVQTANISGLEGKSGWSALEDRLFIEFAASYYDISEKAAFPLKSDTKFTAQLAYEVNEYLFKLYWFKYSEQTGWFRDTQNRFFEVDLPGYDNIDVHFSKIFRIADWYLRFNASAQNILSDDTVLNGIAIRDRRYYVGFEVRY